ncbi:hypothetical protein GCM10020219_071000 [Nonomuraea dietziae]
MTDPASTTQGRGGGWVGDGTIHSMQGHRRHQRLATHTHETHGTHAPRCTPTHEHLVDTRLQFNSQESMSTDYRDTTPIGARADRPQPEIERTPLGTSRRRAEP